MSEVRTHGLPPELAASTKFEVLSKLGEGGMGAVYKARHLFLNELVAIKVMNAAALANPDARSRFLREMQAVGQLKHKNIVRALDAEQIGELLVLVMEYVEGITLDRLVAQKGILPVAYSCQCIARAALGLQFAHEKSMVHRDIKPANLILASKEKEVKLLDFGLVRGPREKTTRDNQTRIGTVMGTPAYMAPEQATDASSADIRADIYSLGCTLYFLLAGHSPFQRDSALTTMMAQVGEQARPLPEVRPEVSAELWAVMAKMLAKKPGDRYQTPKEVEQALRPFVTGSAKGGRPVSGQSADLVEAATLLPNATRELKPLSVPPPIPRAALPTAMQESSPFAVPESGPVGRNKRKTKGKKTSRSWRPIWTAGIAAGLMAVVLIAVIVLKPSPEKQKEKGGEKKPSDGFVPLFNGRDTTGWKPHPIGTGKWEVKDGVLVGSGGMGHLFYVEKNYENFHMVVEAMINDTGNGGVYFRTARNSVAPDGVPGSGYAAQIDSSSKIPIKTGSLFVGSNPVVHIKESPVPANEWFKLEIFADGPHLVIKVNGHITADHTDAENTPRGSELALQVYDSDTVIKFRKVEIKELSRVLPK